MRMMYRATNFHDPTPLELLAIRPKSDDHDVALIVHAFALLHGRSGDLRQVLLELISSVNKRGIPTTDEGRFAGLLVQAIRETRPKHRFVLLGRARSWLVSRNRELGRQARSERGRKGGRGHKRSQRPRPTIFETVVGIVARKAAGDPNFMFKRQDFLVGYFATATPGYSKLDDKGKKHRRDDVRKTLVRIGFILPKKAVKPTVAGDGAPK